MEKSLQRYLRWQRSNGHTQKTIANHNTNIRLFIRWFQEHDYSTNIDQLEADTVREWIEDQRAHDLSPHTIASRIRSLKAWTHWLAEEGWLDRDPLGRLKVPKADDKAQAILTPMRQTSCSRCVTKKQDRTERLQHQCCSCSVQACVPRSC